MKQFTFRQILYLARLAKSYGISHQNRRLLSNIPILTAILSQIPIRGTK